MHKPATASAHIVYCPGGEEVLAYTRDTPTSEFKCVKIDKNVILALSYYPLPAAARRIGLGSTSLKKISRALGVARWPYKPLAAAQHDLEQQHMEVGMSAHRPLSAQSCSTDDESAHPPAMRASCPVTTACFDEYDCLPTLCREDEYNTSCAATDTNGWIVPPPRLLDCDEGLFWDAGYESMSSGVNNCFELVDMY